MTAERILINAAPGETRIAIFESGHLAAVIIDREGSESLVGNIYLGRVTAVLDGLQAAFVDIGEEKAGFLSVADLRPPGDERDADIADFVSEGEAVLVQVLRDAEEEKGAKVTGRPTLTGRDLVFTPGQHGISMSRRISDAAERDRLADIMEGAVPNDAAGGFVLRTAAMEAEAEDIEAEVARLIERWRGIGDERGAGGAPRRLERELEPVFAALRDHGGTDLKAVVVDDPGLLSRLKAFVEKEMPDVASLLTAHNGRKPLFEEEGVDEMIDAALDPVVDLPSGANLIICETPALTAIDVNTGGAAAGSGGREQNALQVNEEAAREIARQIRLRNLSGLIVVDFISMRRRDNQEAVFNALRRAAGRDPLRPHVVDTTRLGLVEMTRRRRGPSLAETLAAGWAAPLKSAETVALEALRAVLKEAALHPSAAYALHASAAVVEALETTIADPRRRVEERLGGRITVVAEANIAHEAFHVRQGGG